MGRGVAGRRRSADWERLGEAELAERERSGEGNRREEVEEVEVEEGDMYLEETCLALGLVGFGLRLPLSFSDVSSGALHASCSCCACSCSCCRWAACEMAATIIGV